MQSNISTKNKQIKKKNTLKLTIVYNMEIFLKFSCMAIYYGKFHL